MLRVNPNNVRFFFTQNFMHFNMTRRILSVSMHAAALAATNIVVISQIRLYANNYQFRMVKPVYYPDRDAETKRIKDTHMMQKQLVANQTSKHLPKDYYYRILGVTRHATTQQIRQAFYGLAKRYHPDSTHSEQKLKHFQELSNAYNILTDEAKRLEYDQLGMVKDEQAFLEERSNATRVQQQQQQKEQRASTQQVNQFNKLTQSDSKDNLMKLTTSDPELTLSFIEGTVGCKMRTDLQYLQKCSACNGKSQLLAKRDVGNELCRRCNGTGKLTKKTPTYTSTETCSMCKGKRYINRNNCDTCENRGFELSTVKVLVNVPPGSKTGDVVTIENPKTKQKVNYHLQIHESDYFKLVGNDVHTEKYLNISEAVLGGNYKVRGLYDDIDLRVAAGTQSHTKVVLKSKGVRTKDGIGNHIITLIVRIPQTLNVKQRQLVLALAKCEDPIYDRTVNSAPIKKIDD